MNRSAFNKSSTASQQISKRNHKIKFEIQKNPAFMRVYKILQKATKSPDHNSDSKGQRFESPRPHQKAAVLDGGLFLLLSWGAGQQKSPSPAPKRQSREGLSCFVGGFGGLTGRTRARAGAVNATRGTAEARRTPSKATRRPACASFRGNPCGVGRPWLRCDQQRGVTQRGLQPGLQAVSGCLRAAVDSIVCPDQPRLDLTSEPVRVTV